MLTGNHLDWDGLEARVRTSDRAGDQPAAGYRRPQSSPAADQPSIPEVISSLRTP